MRWLVLIGRLMLLLVAAAAVVSAFALSRRHDRSARSLGGAYVCPMHPEVTSRAPGDCPICRMSLEPISAPRAESVEPSASRSAAEMGSAESAFVFPDSAHLPNYKLIARPQRRVVAREVQAPAWLEPGGLVAVVLYQDELAGLAPGERARFFRASAPAAGVDVRLTAQPPARWGPSTWRVQFRVDPGRAADRVRALGNGPPAAGWVKLAARSRRLLVVPSSAVLTSSEGPYVLVASADDETLTKRPLEIGRALGGLVVVLSGLRDEERVVVGNAFFLDAERRLRERREMASTVRP